MSHLICTLLFAFLLIICPSLTQADDYPEIMFILDSSGSMSDAVAGKQKLMAAKEVMHEIVPQLDQNIRIGLTAYGHRRPGDCSDIEVLVPAGSDDRAELLGQVDRLQPIGKTPISAAIISVANALKLKDAETTIILVSDGIETCGGDPCQVVAQLKQTGVKFVLHVVGFDVDAQAAAQLECTAGAGGGKYFSAANAADLLDALKSVSKELQEKVQQVDPAKIHTRAVSTGLAKLHVSMPAGSEVSLSHIRVQNGITGEVTRDISKPAADATYPFASGTYKVLLDFATPNYGAASETLLGIVKLAKGETYDLKLGSISFNVAPSLEKSIAVEEVVLLESGSSSRAVTVRANGNGHYNFKPKPVAAGVYDVAIKYSGSEGELLSIVAKQIIVAAGKDTVVTLDAGIQISKADGVVGWALVPLATQAENLQEDGSTGAAIDASLAVKHTGFVGSKDKLWRPYAVPAGKYRVDVYLEGMNEPLVAAEELVISAGELAQFNLGL